MTDEAVIVEQKKRKSKREVAEEKANPYYVLKKIMEMDKANQKKFIDGLLPEFKGTILSMIDAAEEEIKAAWARDNDDADSFNAYYELIMGKPMLPYARMWVEEIYKAKAEGKSVIIEAFRGSTKTTTLTILFTTYRIGKEPHQSNLIIQGSDEASADNSEQISDILMNNPKYKMVFPNVAPDNGKGWGESGYEMKRIDMSYEEWRMANVERKDPTLIAASYSARHILGKHPTGMLILDDMNNEQNTRSEKEMQTVDSILSGTIIPARVKGCWMLVIGTPWNDRDVIKKFIATGQFVHIKTPAFVEAEEDAEGYGIDYFDGKKVRLAWPERFDVRELSFQRDLTGLVEFARMYMLDLSATKNRVFKYQLFPNSEVRYTWPLCGGVDFAGTGDEFKNKSGDNCYFAMAYLAKLPGGGAVVIDGVLDRCTQAQAEEYVNRAQTIFPTWQHSVVEGDGSGDGFIQLIRRNPYLKILPMKTGGRGKTLRLKEDMSPWFENGTVRVSDAETPFLHELRKELDMFPLCDYFDALDAVYWALRGMMDVLIMPRLEYNMLPEARAKVRKNANPMLAFGRR